MDSSTGRSERAAAIRAFLIADIRGYTRFTAQFGDEAASRLTRRFAQVAAEGVEAWGGELVELRGDEALAAFASPRQALRAAVELQSAFADETRSDPELPLSVGIGLDAGEAVPVDEGYRGAALNLAARLCALAGAGEVVASQSMIHLAGQVDGLAYRSDEVAALKGYDEPVALVRVSAVAVSDEPTAMDGAGPHGPGPGLPPELDPVVPIAGRVAEMHWLRWHWRRASHGHGRTVVLSGPPGIGKTRLAAELATIAHEAGAHVLYRPAARLTDGAPIDHASSIEAHPLLTIVDDLDAAPAGAVSSIVESAHDFAGHPMLMLVTHRREAPPQLIAAVERLAPTEQRRIIGPIDADAVRTIVALYAGHATDDAPVGDLLLESGGVPAAVHRVASRWARSSVTGRLGASADRTAAGRRGLRAAEAALIDDVADLALARERERLYGAEPGDEGAAQADSRTICPYKGLAEFEAADAEYYFGRERLIAEIIARFVGGPFLGLVGDSGSGKSSALRAGLLSALAGGVLPGSTGWPQALMRPGEHPMAALARALARALPQATLPADDVSAALDAALAGLASGQRLVVVVDQFEEVFNATRDDAERSAFIDLLTGERTGLKVVVSLRADYYGRCAIYPALARLLGTYQVLVGPLSSDELAAVIEHPAQRVGLRVEPELTQALVADAGTEPGVLPLLSTCLLELWGARQAGRLTLASYRASGGLQGAIARLAEATYADLDPHRQNVARALLLRLAGPGEGAQLVRRRASFDELDAESDPLIEEVLATLTSARLLTTGDDHVEVAHEALLREWPRLQSWLDEDASGREVRLHLIGAVRDWQSRGCETSDLYRGARLAAALDWATEHQLDMNATERAFLEESRAASEYEVERQRRQNRRLRTLLAGAAILLLVAVGAGGFAFLQGQRAENEARNARSRELIASALAVRGQDPSLAKLLAVEALTVVDTPTYQSTSVLHQVLAADPIIGRYSWPADQPVTPGDLWTKLDPTGRLLVAVGGADGVGRLEVADPRTGTVLWSHPAGEVGPANGGEVTAPAWFSADGTQVIAGLWSTDPDVAPPIGVSLGAAIWDARTGQLNKTIDLGPCGGAVWAVSDSSILVWTPIPGPDGRTGCHWTTADGMLTVEAVDLATGSSTPLSDRAWWDGGGSLSGDGRFAAFEEASEAGPMNSVVVDVLTGERVFHRLFNPDNGQYNAARGLNHDGTLLMYGDRPIKVYEVAGGSESRLRAQLSWVGGESASATFDQAGTTWYQTSRDGTLRAWDPGTGQLLSSWPAVGNGRLSVAADGRTVLLGDGLSPSAVLLDIGPRGDLGQVPTTCHGFIPAGSLDVRNGLAAFNEDCSGVSDGSLGFTRVVDLQARQLLTSWTGTWAQQLALSPDGTSFVSQEGGGVRHGPLVVTDLRDGSPLVELQGVCRFDETIPLDEQPGCSRYPQTPFPFCIWNVRWSPDGTMIAAVDGLCPHPSGFAVVWDANVGQVRFKLPIDTSLGSYPGVYQVIFTPDSKRLVLAFDSGLVETLSTESWAVIKQTQLDTSVFGADRLGFIGFTPDGTTILALGGIHGGGDGTLFWLDAATLQVTKSVEHVHTGSPKSMALSPDGSLMATGASDGILRVWAVETGELKQQIDFGGSQVQGIAFIDDVHLAVTTSEGGLLFMTVDPAELADTVRASLSRTFTTTECATYRIDPCPTLDEMRTP